MTDILTSLVSANNHVNITHDRLVTNLQQHKIYDYIREEEEYEDRVNHIQERINNDILHSEEIDESILAHNAKFMSQATESVENQLDIFENVQFGVNIVDSLSGLLESIPVIGPMISSILHIGSSVISNIMALHHSADALIKNFNISTIKDFITAGKSMLTLRTDETQETEIVEKGKSTLAAVASKALSSISEIVSSGEIIGQKLGVYTSPTEVAMVFPEDLSTHTPSSTILISRSPLKVDFKGGFNMVYPVDSKGETMTNRFTLPLPSIIMGRIKQMVAKYNLATKMDDQAGTIAIITNLIDNTFGTMDLGQGLKHFFHEFQ